MHGFGPRSSYAARVNCSRYSFPVAAILLATTLVAGPAHAAATSTSPGSCTASAAGSTTVRPAADVEAKLGKSRVLLVSIDGLNPKVAKKLGKKAPTFTRLRRQGAGTLNARTPFERTQTLPNHTSMVTGLRPNDGEHGHGVIWNDDRDEPATVHEAAGRYVGSVFSKVRGAGGSSALFSTKEKFGLLERSWPRKLRTVIDPDDADLTKAAIRDLTGHKRAFTMLHLGLPDHVGHQHGAYSKQYRAAVRKADALLGKVLRKVRSSSTMRKHLTVIVTADHGMGRHGHADPSKRDHYRIPFFIWGKRVDAANLYKINPGYTFPGKGRPGYDDPQPIRNGDAANLALDLLGLGAIKDSVFNDEQRLRWRKPNPRAGVVPNVSQGLLARNPCRTLGSIQGGGPIGCVVGWRHEQDRPRQP